MSVQASPPAAVRGVPRDEAVALHGSHWAIDGSGSEPGVREVLGRDPDEDGGGTLEAMEEKAIALRRRSAEGDVRRAGAVLGAFGNRARIMLAHAGIHPRSEQVLAVVEEQQALLDAGRAALGDLSWRPARASLADVVRVPPTLPVGTLVWEVGHEWIMEHGVRLRELRVVGVDVYDFGSDGWEYGVVHRTERLAHGPGTPAGSPSFGPAPDGPVVPVPERTVPSSRLFLTLEAATAFMQRLADSLEDRAREARTAARDARERAAASGPPGSGTAAGV